MELNIYCEYTKDNNSNLFQCVHCHRVVGEHNRAGNICPVLIDKEAKNNGVVKLVETKIVSQETGEEISDWWDTTVSPYVPEQSVPQNDPGHRKQCTKEQIEERMNICQSCPFYENNTCLKCGCSLSRDQVYMNKLNWADQSCPIGKWGAIN